MNKSFDGSVQKKSRATAGLDRKNNSGLPLKTFRAVLGAFAAHADLVVVTGVLRSTHWLHSSRRALYITSASDGATTRIALSAAAFRLTFCGQAMKDGRLYREAR